MIYVYGDVIADEYIIGTATRICPEAPVPVTDVKGRHLRIGGAANVSRHLTEIGCDSVCLVPPQKIPRKTRVITNGTQIARLDTPRDTFKQTPLEAIDDESAVAAVLVDYEYGTISDQLVSDLKKQRIRLFCDAKYDFMKVSSCYLVKSNKKEAADYFQVDLDDNWKSEMKSMRYALSAEILVITAGAKGAYYCTETECEFVPTRRVDVVDVTGAGDIFMAQLVYELTYTNASIKAAVISATSAASDWVSKYHFPTEETVVFTNGCFDILHPGHISVLLACRALGTKVIVGLNSDESVTKLKGKMRPVMPLATRQLMLEATGLVDEIVVFDEPTPKRIIDRINPDVIVKGGDYTREEVVGGENRQVVIVPTLANYSTTDIIKRIKSR